MADIDNADSPDQLAIEHRVVDGVRVVTVRGEIDQTVQEAFGKALLEDDGGVPPRIVLDLGGVTFMDSSGINVLLSAHRRASAADGWLRLAGARDAVLRVLQLVGVDTVIGCYPTVEQAQRPHA
ncbi:STAS domain-containing protein [Streptomyces sp. NPDC056464]|uniref:STAS domain-containing protein n=1 Tax=Streptomyces sp. NPDC056464 TaxID=3345828 RepID=UPI00367E4983